MDFHGLKEATIRERLPVIIVMVALANVAVGLRLYTRFLVIRKPAIEDAFITLSLLFSIGTAAAIGFGMEQRAKFLHKVAPGSDNTLQSVRALSGKDDPTVDSDAITKYFQALYASILTYGFGICFTKLSILLQYFRICTSPVARKVTIGAIVFVTMCAIQGITAAIFQCTPVSYFWNRAIPGGFCVNQWALYFAHAGISIFTDIMILLLPVFILRDIRWPKLQKLMLWAILAVGGFACIASIIRLRALYQFSKSQNQAADGIPTAVWSTIELNVAIVCASISTLRPLLESLIPHGFSSQIQRNRPMMYACPDDLPDLTVTRGCSGQLDEAEKGKVNALAGVNVVTTEEGTHEGGTDSSKLPSAVAWAKALFGRSSDRLSNTNDSRTSCHDSDLPAVSNQHARREAEG